jgi:hypothetical protein
VTGEACGATGAVTAGRPVRLVTVVDARAGQSRLKESVRADARRAADRSTHHGRQECV